MYKKIWVIQIFFLIFIREKKRQFIGLVYLLTKNQKSITVILIKKINIRDNLKIK